MWDDFWTKNQKGFLFAVGMIFFLTAGLIIAGFPSPAKSRIKSNKIEPKAVAQAPTPKPDAEREIAAINAVDSSANASRAVEPQSNWVLYVTGAVRRPGVYTLPAGSRLFKLVEAAGGLDASADPAAVNMAAVLGDGLHVHVTKKGEEQPAYASYGNPAPGAPKTGLPKTGLPVDINRASVEELTALKGIGPVLAGNIVEYRFKNGRFRNVDDLLHVKGIGHKKLEQFRDSVIVGP